MSTIYMQRQSNDANTTIPSGGVIYFNDDLTQSGNISYDSQTGIITLGQTGVYYAYWSVVTEQSPNDAEISLVTSDNNTFISDASQQAGMIVGSAIIEAPNTGLELSLRNTSNNSIELADADIVANFVIHAIEMDSFISQPDINVNGGSVVNFTSGGVDVANPLTFPILLDILQISFVSNQIDVLKDICSPEGLESLLLLPVGILSNPLVSLVLSPAFAAVQLAIDTLLGPLQDMFDLCSNNGLLSMDAYIGHSNVGIVPAIAGGDLPILSLVAGPPYPQIIARDGIITSFAAEYDVLAAVDISLINLLPGAINTVNGLILGVVNAFQILITTIGSIAGTLLFLGTKLPSDYADRLNKFLISEFRTGTPITNHHVHAILWKGTPNDLCALGGDVRWEKVSDLDLGLVQWLQLAPVDAFLSSLGDVIAAGGNLLDTLLSLLGSRGFPNQSPTNTPFLDAKTSSIMHPVSAGDYLMVQFTLVGNDNTTVLAGVIATNLMASVQIENVQQQGG